MKNNIPQTRIRELGLVWDKRHREWILGRLAEFFKSAEIVTMMLQEFAVEWDLGDPSNPIARQRLQEVHDFVATKVKYYAYNKRSTTIQGRIKELREQYRKELEKNFRVANKFARIRDLDTIKAMAMKDKQFMAAVKAVEAIRVEVEGLAGTQININNNTQINNNGQRILTIGEIDDELKRLLHDAGIGGSQEAALLLTGNEGAGALPPRAQEAAAHMENGSDAVSGGPSRMEEGNDRVELPPGVSLA